MQAAALPCTVAGCNSRRKRLCVVEQPAAPCQLAAHRRHCWRSQGRRTQQSGRVHPRFVCAATAPAARAQLPATFGTGKWRVRLMADSEMMAAAEIQFQGFHRPSAFLPLNALAAMNFRAEVVSTLKTKLQYNTPDNFACLVAERTGGDRALGGAADVSIQKDREVLRQLPEHVEQYAYVSSMAVDAAARRQGAAQAMLGASERLARTWKLKYLALHLHGDNQAALQLYQRWGFQEISRATPFLGRNRILMAKLVK